MARYAYDINTTQRYIDVHKQFQGGLKTVDTDDSLGAVFLRQAENISLSEFGFIEKRYGTFETFKAAIPNITTSSKLQGYWEFMGKYIITFVDGKLYSQLLSQPETTFTHIQTLHKVEGLTYPQNLGNLLNAYESDTEIEDLNEYAVSFQIDRPMGAVNVSNVLYIFTGKYPIYLAEDNGVLKAYPFAQETPTFAELVVTGHNLLEEDYEELYYTGVDALDSIGVDETLENKIKIKDSNFFPRIPFAKDGTIDFKLSYDTTGDLLQEFVFDTVNQPESTLNTVSLKSLQYRPSGPGASDLEFINVDANSYEANALNNIPESIVEDIDVVGNAEKTATLTIGTNLTETEGTVFTFKRNYWGNNQIALPGGSPGEVLKRLALKEQSNLDMFTANYKEVSILIDDIAVADYLDDNKKVAVEITELGNYETKLSNARSALNTWAINDLRQGNFEVRINYSGNSIYYALIWKNNETLIPVLGLLDAVSGTTVTNIGQASLSWSFVGSKIFVTAYGFYGNLFYNDYIEYEDVSGNVTDFNFINFTRAYPLSDTDRASLTALRNKLNQPTVIEFIEHANHGGAAEDIILETYIMGQNLEYEGGFYKFVLPEGLPPDNINHYALRVKTVDVTTTTETSLSLYLNEDITDILNNEPKFYRLNDLESVLFDVVGADFKYYYPNVSQFSSPGNNNFTNFVGKTFNLRPITNTIDLQAFDELGSSLLNVKINQGLLSGTYDFKFNYVLKQTQINYTNLQQVQIGTDIEFNHIIKDITITEEKLQDYTFFQGARAHPIWSCNQVLEHFGKLMVYGSQEMPTAVFYSFPDRPFYFPSKFYLDFTNEENKPIVSVAPYMNILVAQTEDQTWGIKGNSGLIDAPSPYVEFSINNTVGTIAPKSVRPVRNHLFFLSKIGVIALKSLYAADEQYNIEFVDRNIKNIIPPDHDAVGVQFDNQYWLNFPNFGITLRWYIDKKAWVLDRFNAWNDFNGVFKWQVKDGKLEFVSLPSRFPNTGNSYIYKIGVDYSLPTDLGGDVFTKFETSFLNQNYPFHPKNYKELKLDFTVQNEYNLSREAIYTMDSNEDITDNVHKIDNVDLLKNHRYRIVYNFSDHSLDEDIIEGDDFSENNHELISGNDFSENNYILFGALSFSLLGAQDLQITSVVLTDKDNNQTVLLPNEDFTIVEENDFDEYIDFLLPNGINGVVDIIVEGQFSTYDNGAVMYDITYDNNLQINNWVVSEDATLNLDNIESYDQAKAKLDIDFDSRLGEWVFGSSDFGNKVTAVKTVKLSGKGYNAKLYIEDTSKSKWTMESLGLTYKMKRARSR